MCGLATLAKGPAGLGLPVLTLGLFLLLAGRLERAAW
jgi:4-amino-4-deoxy-L-arabinose transferase-like glycosyltransferase